ncbi:hypothetical protein MM300_19800 [Evansella sp. LMS18]|uniref:hypothetical protein n=1 Tax=Evansella sp. LMS18 TaxID=2924033 RepID=UPI0020D04A1E|nr:hypothetical protein [Evansella sp. LMS18]UTR10096.1 hypothetical protein MM300_19800 [Evansella sp. LMS18]
MSALTMYGKVCVISSVLFFALGLALLVYSFMAGEFMRLTITFLGLGFVFAGNLYIFKEFSFLKKEKEEDSMG